MISSGGAPRKDGMTREDAASLLKHFLVFFNVGDRSWAISQNLLISGRDVEGNDGYAQLLGFGGQDVGRGIGENTDHIIVTS